MKVKYVDYGVLYIKVTNSIYLYSSLSKCGCIIGNTNWTDLSNDNKKLSRNQA
jgi:hypothetical protein